MATGENFFKTFNKTVTKPFRANRISVNRTHSISTPVDNPNREISVKSDKSKRSISPPAIYSRKRMALMVPRAVQDIVDIVNLEKSYQKLRKPKKDETLFEFDIEVAV